MSGPEARTTRWISNAYRALARALPRSYRDTYLRESLHDLNALLERERAGGNAGRELWVGLRALADLLQRIPREWLARGAALGRPTTMGEGFMNALNEIRLAARALSRRFGFTTVAVLTLALGIGANVAIFAVVDAVLIRPLNYPESQRIVTIMHHAPGLDLPDLENSEGMLRFYWQNAPFLSSLAGYDTRDANLTGGDRPARVQTVRVTPQIFDVLRTQPALGRPFNEADAAEGAAPVAILTHAEWVDRFGSDPGILGKTIALDGVTTEIVGVMPDHFSFPDPDAAALLPMHVDPNGEFGTFGIGGVARLGPGITLAQAQQRIQELQARLPSFFPNDEVTPEFMKSSGWAVSVEPLRKRMVGDVASALWIILGTVGFVLLIACANVANLFLVRAESRQKELAIRSAMGAGRARLASLFLSESVLLGLGGGAVGVALAWAGVRLLVSFGPHDLPRLNEVGVDGRVLLFAAALSVLAGFAFGALPLLRRSAFGVATALRDQGRGSTSGRERHRTRNVLVAGQIALALVLVVGSGLMVRSFQHLRSVDAGFDPTDVLTVGLSLGDVESLPAAARFYQRAADQAAALPGVKSVGVTTAIPLGTGNWNGGSFHIESKPRADDQLPPVAMYKAVGPGYFEAMGMTLEKGRTVKRSDIEDGVPVAWVNETFARTLLDGDALGQHIRWSNGADSSWAEVVGVVKDVREFGLTQPVRAVAYLPLVTGGWGFPHLNVGFLVVKADRDPSALVQPIRDIIRRLDPNVPVTTTSTMGEVVSRSMRQTSFTLVLLGIATLVALFLGAIGLFGVVSYVVSQRTREIGVRVALGARPDDIRTMVLRQGVGVYVTGALVGLAGAFALTRLMGTLLFQVSATDPVSFVLAPTVLLAVAAFATWLPARRAARVDPMEALRAE